MRPWKRYITERRPHQRSQCDGETNLAYVRASDRSANGFATRNGSRPPDLRWDGSGDGSVTSLDALMILQSG
jgi:hypothetical protein